VDIIRFESVPERVFEDFGSPLKGAVHSAPFFNMTKNNWLIFARRTLALEKQLRPKLISLTKDFRAEFIHDLQTHGQHAAIANLQQTTIADKLAPTIDKTYRVGGLMGAKLTAEEHSKMLTAKDKRQITLYLQENQKTHHFEYNQKAVIFINPADERQVKAAFFGRNEAWIAEVIKYLQYHLLKFIQDITNTMRDDMVRILQRGIDKQLSLSEIVRNLQDTGLIEARANVIARTEIVRAANVGHSIAAKSFPYEVSKKWSAARDHRTRESHVLINDHMVDENDYFEVPIFEGKKRIGTEPMLYPGDANASAANTVNCRCRALYPAKRDTAGNLIMRDQTQAPVVLMRMVPSYEPAQIAAILKSNINITVK
jgi:hypothetical protein